MCGRAPAQIGPPFWTAVSAFNESLEARRRANKEESESASLMEHSQDTTECTTDVAAQSTPASKVEETQPPPSPAAKLVPLTRELTV